MINIVFEVISFFITLAVTVTLTIPIDKEDTFLEKGNIITIYQIYGECVKKRVGEKNT